MGSVLTWDAHFISRCCVPDVRGGMALLFCHHVWQELLQLVHHHLMNTHIGNKHLQKNNTQFLIRSNGKGGGGDLFLIQ